MDAKCTFPINVHKNTQSTGLVLKTLSHATFFAEVALRSVSTPSTSSNMTGNQTKIKYCIIPLPQSPPIINR